MKTTVCCSCPWNRRSTLGYWDPAHLIGIAYACSADIPVGTMGCHQWNGHYSPSRQPGNASLCGGWVRVAPDSGTVRVGLLKGLIDPSDCADRDWHELYPDPVSMLRWNGIDASRLPPLSVPEGGAETVRAWISSLIELNGTMRANPEAARAYVIPCSPAEYGVLDDGRPKMPERLLRPWRELCAAWEAAR